LANVIYVEIFLASPLAHDAPPDLLVGLGGGHPLPRTPIGASFPILLAIHHWEQGRQLAKAGPGLPQCTSFMNTSPLIPRSYSYTAYV